MWNNTNELFIGGTGQAYVAPDTASAPAAIGAVPAGGYVGLGYHSEDGVSLTVTPNVTDFPVWQSRQPARRENQAQEILTSFALVQWDEDTVPFAFGGGTVTTGTPNKYEFPKDDDPLASKSLIVDVADGNNVIRFYWNRGNVTEAVTAAFNRTNLSQLPVGYKALAPQGGGSPGFFLTNMGSFASGS